MSFVLFHWFSVSDGIDSLVGQPVLRTFVLYLIAFCSRWETAIDVISGNCVDPIVCDKRVKLCYLGLNLYREILPESVGGAVSTVFFAITSDRKYLVTSYPMCM